MAGMFDGMFKRPVNPLNPEQEEPQQWGTSYIAGNEHGAVRIDHEGGVHFAGPGCMDWTKDEFTDLIQKWHEVMAAWDMSKPVPKQFDINGKVVEGE